MDPIEPPYCIVGPNVEIFTSDLTEIITPASTTPGTAATTGKNKIDAKAAPKVTTIRNPPLVRDVSALLTQARALGPLFLSFRGGALYNYYHHYVDKAAMFDVLERLGLTAGPLVPGAPAPGGLMEILGYIVHGTRTDLASSNVADVFNSIINMLGTSTTIVVLLLSPALARRYGKKAVAVVGFGLSALSALAFYLLSPGNVGA